MKTKIWKIYNVLCDIIFEYVFLVCLTFALALLAKQEPFAIKALIFVIVFNVIWGCIKYTENERERRMENTCKNCKWCAINDLGDMICVNSESEYTADYVDETHVCEEYESKRKEHLVSQ